MKKLLFLLLSLFVLASIATAMSGHGPPATDDMIAIVNADGNMQTEECLVSGSLGGEPVQESVCAIIESRAANTGAASISSKVDNKAKVISICKLKKGGVKKLPISTFCQAISHANYS